MKVKLVTLASIILCVFGSFASKASDALIFVPAELDLGEINPVETVSRKVKIVNPGNSPVRIVRARACCGAKVSLSSSVVPPSESVEMDVAFTSGLAAGVFRKSVTVVFDKAQSPLVTYNIKGVVREAFLAKSGFAVEVLSSNLPSPTSVESGVISSSTFVSIALPSVLFAGLVDGFNPCAFSIVIILAGILAVGGRRRKSQILGGVAFCLSSFMTYMFMGFGLLEAIRALSGFYLVRNILFAILSVFLFALSFLSFRDAFRYRVAGVPSVITLQLPDGVKKAIRCVAERSWSGPTVVFTSLLCGFLVTLLDSLCTGQVYVPVLVLLSKQNDSAYTLLLLALYNIAFISPLVAIFIFSAFGVGSERMRIWSKRNVFPSKIALGFLFLALGVLLLFTFSSRVKVFSAESPAVVDVMDVDKKAEMLIPSQVESISDEVALKKKSLSRSELADGNEMLHALLKAEKLDPAYPDYLAQIVSDVKQDEQWRNHALQFVPDCMMRLEKHSAKWTMLSAVLRESLSNRKSVLAGTALLGYVRLSEKIGEPDKSEVGAMAVSLASDAASSVENIVTALRVGTELKEDSILSSAKYWARYGESQFLRCVAISVIRDLGMVQDQEFLRSLLPARTKAEESVIMHALKSTKERR